MASKPDNVKEGILQGKINKHLAEICFMDQMYLDDEKNQLRQFFLKWENLLALNFLLKKSFFSFLENKNAAAA